MCLVMSSVFGMLLQNLLTSTQKLFAVRAERSGLYSQFIVEYNITKNNDLLNGLNTPAGRNTEWETWFLQA